MANDVQTDKGTAALCRRLETLPVSVVSDVLTAAVMGGNVALSLKLRGCRGVLTDGGVRDLDEYEEIGMPVFCSFLTTLAPKGRWHYAELDVPIALPGQATASVPVRPGDLIQRRTVPTFNTIRA
jgi:regulator of RNase E activity RraA